MAIEINHQEVLTPPTPSATVMVLRDSPGGLEVLLVRRHGNSKVLGGVHVFPGGKLDALDCQTLDSQLEQTAVMLAASLGEAELDAATGAGLYVAALRETFEECGLLLHRELPQHVPAELRQHLKDGLGFAAAMAQIGLPLQTSALKPWARWITPRVPSVSTRRFDARFFVALAPEGQEVLHDDHEVTETVWLTPESALRQYWSGDIGLVPAQIMSLSQLVRHPSAAEVMAAANARLPLLVEPEPFMHEGVRTVCYPGDPQHSVKHPVWTAPTRLTFRNNRFEPEGGLAALLG
ncbi:MAG: NUDIX domain-containing protein [Polaromonas sp.]|nr:NUDIX domain-containing protein [Polaromonas sp.]